MQSFQLWAERIAIRCLPGFFTVLMLLLGGALSRIPGAGQVMPLLNIICIYYWCILFQEALPYWFLFILGILQDTLAGTPLGVTSLINLVFAWIVINRFPVVGNMSFSTLWLRFLVLSLAIIMLGWLIMSIYYSRFLPVTPQLLQWGSSSMAYPAVHCILTYLYQKVSDK